MADQKKFLGADVERVPCKAAMWPKGLIDQVPRNIICSSFDDKKLVGEVVTKHGQFRKWLNTVHSRPKLPKTNKSRKKSSPPAEMDSDSCDFSSVSLSSNSDSCPLSSGSSSDDGYHSSGDHVEAAYNPNPTRRCPEKPRNSMDGLAFAVQTAYNNHIPLSLSASDFLLRLQGIVANAINSSSEELREAFVDHEGRMELQQLHLPGGVDYSNKEFAEESIAGFAERVAATTKNGMAAFFTDPTSTATPASRIACAITLMDAAKSYFHYRSGFICGIPSITLRGTLEDWQVLREKVVWIRQMMEKDGLPICGNWLRLVEDVVDKMVEAVETGESDRQFWSSIARRVRGGCGGPFFDGWITLFYSMCLGDDIDQWTKGSVEKRFADKARGVRDRNYWARSRLFPYELPKIFPKIREGPLTMRLSTATINVDADGPDPAYKVQLFSGSIGAQLVDGVLEPVIGWFITRP
jgi:hypothetical protein